MRLSERLIRDGKLDKKELSLLLSSFDGKDLALLSEEARRIRDKEYGRKVFLRALVEISNHCRCNCLYCGIRRDNRTVRRYRLEDDVIIAQAELSYSLGMRTLVLQGGEDQYFSDDRLERIIRSVKEKHSDMAITLSLGERSEESYRRLFLSGAERYLLREESITKRHFQMLHPEGQKIEERIRCIQNLRKIGYQVGLGFMVGSPYQSDENIANDITLISCFAPQMVGIGPFIHAENTPFENEKNGSLEKTLLIISVLRIMRPKLLLPSTTALGALDPRGRDMGLEMGANVIMPNMTPQTEREKYNLYDGKPHVALESAEEIKKLEEHLTSLGYEIARERGDSHEENENYRREYV